MLILKHWFLFLLLLWCAAAVLGPRLDIMCIEGRFSAEQAEEMNSSEWGKCPKYRNGNCNADEGDRIWARECSEFGKALFLQEYIPDIKKWWRDRQQ